MSRGFQLALLSLASGSAAYAIALVWLPSSLVDGHYIPVGTDSFYHARRILDTVANPGAFYEFDPRIHAPEGSWITWPWGYDFLLAWIVLVLQKLSGTEDPMAILVYVPPTWAFVNASLLIGIGATLGLRPTLLAVLGTCFAFFPLTQCLHGLGVIDHHYVEYSFVLSTILSGTGWLQAPGDTTRAGVLGAVLGIAPAFHNGLFALQIPVVASLLLLWLHGRAPPARSVQAFAAALVGFTLAVLLPSEPFRAGQFSFTTLSWFHLHVAILTAAGATFLAWRPFSPQYLAWLTAAGLVALAPAAGEIAGGSRFLTATLVKLNEMQEAASLRDQFETGGLPGLIRTYSGLILPLPFSIAGCVWLLLRRPVPERWVFPAVFGIFGAALMCFQLRLHYYGSPVLFLSPLLALQYFQSRATRNQYVLAQVAVAAGMVAAYRPCLSNLFIPAPGGWNSDYMYTRQIYSAFHDACAEHPGIVLADNNDGHYIRYHTDCSVISNNFILTPQHEQKLLLTDRLFAMPVREIIDRYPYIDYIYVRRTDNIFEDLDPVAVAEASPPLVRELLLRNGPFPPDLRVAVELRSRPQPGRDIALARVFRIDRSAGARPGDKG